MSYLKRSTLRGSLKLWVLYGLLLRVEKCKYYIYDVYS